MKRTKLLQELSMLRFEEAYQPRKRSCTDPSSLKIEQSSLHQVMSKTILSRLRY